MQSKSDNTSLFLNLKKDLKWSHDKDYSPSPFIFFIAFLAVTLSFIWFFEEFIFRQIQFGIQKQADWGHTLLVPFISSYFIWVRKNSVFSKPFYPFLWGCVIVLIGMAIYVTSSLGPPAFRHHNIMGFSFVFALFGLLLTIFGINSFRWILFPLFYMLLFGQTISERVMEVITYPLQDFAAQASWVVLSLLFIFSDKLDVSISGNTLSIVNGVSIFPLNIAEACSGMRMVVAFLALGTAMSALSVLNLWQKFILVLAAVPVALGVNVLRITSLGLFTLINPNFASGDTHGFIGMLWLIPGLGLFLVIRWVITQFSNSEIADMPEEGKTKFVYQSSIIFVCFLGSILFIVSGIGSRLLMSQMNAYLTKEPVDLNWQLTTLPTKLGNWKMDGEDAAFDAAMIEEVGTSNIITRSYRKGSRRLLLHVAYYTGQIDAVPHVPDRCMVAGGYEALTPEPENVDLSIGSNWTAGKGYQAGYPIAVTRESQNVSMPLGEKTIRLMEFRDPASPGVRRHSGYFFIANGTWTATPDGVRLLAFDLKSQKSYYCKVQFDGAGSQSYTRSEYMKDVESFAEALMPNLMYCLPDWPLLIVESNK